MKELITVRPDKSRLINIIEDISKGRVKIPLFQREFVWKDKQMLELFDSMEKGYPIGSLLFWKPEESFKFYENFGPYIIFQKSSDIKYVLDGYQRLSTLYGVLTNPKSNHAIESKSIRDFSIFYDLQEEEFTYSKKKKDITFIPLYVLIDTYEFLGFIDNLRTQFDKEETLNVLIDRAKNLAKTFVDYELPFIDIKGGDITSSVDIFSRTNSTGTRISTDWMVSALSYNPNESFLFSEKIENFLVEVEIYNFQNLSRETILHCIECATNKAYFDVKAEDLARRKNFPELVLRTLANIKKAIKFLNEKLNIIEYRLLPYNSQLIFLAEFFRINPNPNEYEEQKLVDWFWITSYSNYFTQYSLSKQRRALTQFKLFAEEKSEIPVYYYDINQVFFTNPFPDKIDFGSVRSKTFILFMLNYIYKIGINVFNASPSSLEISYLIPQNKSTSNMIFYKNNELDILTNSQKKQDLSFLLETELPLDKYFISDSMTNLYKQGKTEELISQRRFLIQSAERNFVESLGLKYSFE